MTNITIAYNSSVKPGGGLYSESGAHPVGKNLILYYNVGPEPTSQIYVTATATFVTTYSCIQWGYAGTGNIFTSPTFVTGPQGSYYLSQTAAGQPVNSSCVDAGDPTSQMVIGTTRTDQIQDQGVIDIGFHYTIPAAPPQIDVTLTPINPPIQIPSNGGAFQFTAAVQRTAGQQAPFWGWCRIKNPDGSYTGPTVGPVQINPPVGVQVSRQRTQNVPGAWPSGTYTYLGYAHTSPQVYPAIDSSSFTFVKLTDGPVGPLVWEASCTGEPFPGEAIGADRAAPQKPELVGISPNPFNPTTSISYEIPEAGIVRLEVYDVAGRLVATLAEEWRSSGTHEVAFDGSNLASGTYLYLLSTGDRKAFGKMLLLK